jgi:hypothetical protein
MSRHGVDVQVKKHTTTYLGPIIGTCVFHTLITSAIAKDGTPK